jgi:hypothetical protein
MGERATATGNMDMRSFMISSQDSCLYGPGASDMTVGRDISNTGFQWPIDWLPGEPRIDSDNNGTIQTRQIQPGNDSITTPTSSGGGEINMSIYEQVYLDPVRMYLEDVSAHIGTVGTDWTSEAGSGNAISMVDGRVQEIDEKLLRNSFSRRYLQGRRSLGSQGHLWYSSEQRHHSRWY